MCEQTQSRCTAPPQHTGGPRRQRTSAVAVLLVGLAASRSYAQADLRGAEQDLLQGRVDHAISTLQGITGQQPGNGPAHLLLCRAFLSELRAPEAAGECRFALKAGLDGNSDAQDWAGRAFGLEAQHAGPISGLKLAVQVRSSFQTAFKLNPRSAAAANDLGEFYIDAPAIVGGGADKAAALADSIQSTLPETAHRLRALLAEKQGDAGGAEREFVAATAVGQAPGAYVDLGCFYVRQHRPDKATVAARRAIALDRALDANVFDAASTLNDVHQPAPAMDVLHNYLDRGQKSDAAPAFRAHTLLGEILLSQGDKNGARREFQTALSLASNYAPAQKDLDAL